ncbi:hypothetical protein AncyloWKF20_04155 [Ancylobacter sp. WKF20]|uniref:hypothetical protein n=1 Tax=Ancylobacter sp. WKF20 TaxID=3039801 RepID=UPI002434141E|nr:hypothetical protein [Ancylobacter sp. WKF20]WGD31031.1 hypothetical protein AncyloWKF20_04155 [Ancylobacter sp. WKF20]
MRRLLFYLHAANATRPSATPGVPLIERGASASNGYQITLLRATEARKDHRSPLGRAEAIKVAAAGSARMHERATPDIRSGGYSVAIQTTQSRRQRGKVLKFVRFFQELSGAAGAIRTIF